MIADNKAFLTLVSIFGNLIPNLFIVKLFLKKKSNFPLDLYLGTGFILFVEVIGWKI